MSVKGKKFAVLQTPAHFFVDSNFVKYQMILELYTCGPVASILVLVSLILKYAV